MIGIKATNLAIKTDASTERITVIQVVYFVSEKIRYGFCGSYNAIF